MAQEHLDRLSATDASFLINEGRASHMHVGGITIFEGPPPALAETWFVEGLEGNRFALISKTHHSLIDGIASVDLATVLFDLTPVPQPVEVEGEEWEPHSEPSSAELAIAGVRGLVGAAAGLTT